MKTLYKGTLTKRDTPATGLEVRYGLQKLGNQRPYFSVTATEYSRGRDVAGGCMHDEVLKRFPQFADLVQLHLSDLDGVPMHAESNGWYWACGAAGGLGEKYHGGSSEGDPSPTKCLEYLANHLRISQDEAKTLVQAQLAHRDRAAFTAYVESQKPRWKVEADAAILNHQLEVPR